MKRSAGRILFFLLHLMGFILLWFVIRDLDWKQFFEVMLAFPAWKYFTGIMILCLVYALKSLRWYMLNRSFGILTNWYTALVYYLAAGFLSVITPGRLGEFAKIYFLKRKYGIDTATATSSVILDRIWDVLILSFAAGLSVVFLLSGAGINQFALVLMAALFLVSLSIILIPGVIFSPFLFALKRFPRMHQKLAEILSLWKQNKFKSFLLSFAITVTAVLMLAAIPILFSDNTAFPVRYSSGIAAISISNILSFIPVTVAGFGTRELVFTEVWKLSEHPKEVAISISTAYFIITYLGSLLIGGVVYLFNLKQLYLPAEILKMKKEL